MPIQRIPRYRLLLQELLKLTDQNDPEYKKLNDALEIIKNVAAEINKQKAHAEEVFELNQLSKMCNLPVN